jgi:hypothetical protein
VSNRTFRDEWLEELRIVVVAGALVGVAIGGVGLRLAMLVLRVTSPDYVVGLTSDDGFVIGEVSLLGTYQVVALGGVVGLLGAGAWRLVQPWLVGPGWFHRFTFALTAGLFVGGMILHADGVDFRVLEPLWLAVVLFVGLPVLVALVLSLAVDAVAGGRLLSRGRARWLAPLVLLAAFPPLLPFALVGAGVIALVVGARRTLQEPAQRSIVASTVVRAVFLVVPVTGAVMLTRDLTALF